MDIKQMKLSELTPYENNPRYNDDAVDKVAESIRQFGFNQPIVVDENNVIVVGHTRYRAAESLGLEDVPVYQLKGLTEEQYNAYRIIDNKTAEFADWDWAALDEELKNINDIDMEFFDLTADDVDDFTQEDFNHEAPDKPDFYITLTFDIKYENDIKGKIKEYGIESITEKVQELILNFGNDSKED